VRIFLILLLALGTGCYVDPFGTGAPDDDDLGPGGADDDDGTDDDDASGDDDDASGDDDDASDDDDDGFPPADPVTDPDGLAGRVYSLDLSAATFVEPPGADGVLSLLLNDEYLLFGVEESSDFAAAAQPGVHFLGASGEPNDDGLVIQDQCNETIDMTAGPDSEFGTADDVPGTFTNPWVELGPTDLVVEISNAPSVLKDVEITGRFEPDGSAFVDGTLRGDMDLRPLDDQFGGEVGDACQFVEDTYGVPCEECGSPNPGPYCMTLVAEDLAGDWLEGTAMEPRSCSDIIWNWIATGECESAARGYDEDADGNTDGTYQGCPQFDG